MIVHEGWIKAVDAKKPGRYVAEMGADLLDLDTEEGDGQLWYEWDPESCCWEEFRPGPDLWVFRIPERTATKRKGA